MSSGRSETLLRMNRCYPNSKRLRRKAPFASSLPQREDSTKVNLPGNLIERSDVISFNGTTTLVPKKAIIDIPEQYKSRLNNHKPGNRIVRWNEFLSLNRGWITTVSVSRTQAEGNEPVDPKTVEVYSKSKNLVIAVYQGGPVSMLPQKKEEAPIQTASKDTEP